MQTNLSRNKHLATMFLLSSASLMGAVDVFDVSREGVYDSKPCLGEITSSLGLEDFRKVKVL